MTATRQLGGLLLLLGVLSVAGARDADLIGYGRLSLRTVREGAGGVAVLTCAGPAEADRLLSKLRADYGWDTVAGPPAVTVAGVPGWRLADGRLLVFAALGREVYAVSAATEAQLGHLLRQYRLTAPAARFVAAKRHPRGLDYFDLQPISIYQHTLNVRDMEQGWRRYDREVLDRLGAFWAQRGYGVSQFGPYQGCDELADGAAHFFPQQYMIGLTRSHQTSYMTHVGQHWVPWWLRNRYPRDIIQFDPYALSGWGPFGAMAGGFLSQQASPAAYAYAQRFASQALDHLATAAGDDLGCFRTVGGGHPGDEMGLHHQSTEFMDYDEAGQAAFRQWLRDTRGLDLAALGQRWHGDPQRFHAWSDVHLPSQFEFFGGFGADTLNLLTGWRWRPDSPRAEDEGWGRSDYQPTDDWTPTALAPSTSQLFLFGSARDKELRQGRSTVAWFRQEFDPGPWLQQHPGPQVYLVAQVGDPQTQPVEAWLNDAYLGALTPKTVWCGPIAFRATSLLRPGRNVLCLKIASGVIRGPVFLTREEPKRYPYLGAQANARFVDLRDWTAQRLIRGWEREARLGRAKLPDVPLLFCPGGSREYWNEFLGLKRSLGIAGVHFTGGGSSYMPWWAGLGYVLGSSMSSEEGGTIWEPAGLTRELSWMLLDAHGHHNYYYDALDCRRIEERTGWFTKHARQLDLVGKATWQRPPVAVLRAARSDLYFPYTAQTDDWDIGRSSLQAAHYQNVYVTEAELEAGLAADYPVVFDAGTTVFDDRLLAAIERYVRGGGTYVAVNVTGRHSLLQADAWPIEKLTGFKVVGERTNMLVTVTPDNPLLRRLAGLTFNGSGVAVNWMGVNHLAEGAVALQPQDGDGQVLARWEDGTVAAGLRRLGKGRVVVLGSSFWRSMSDRAGNGISLNGTVQTTFFGDLFSGLGIPRQAEVDSEDVWVRRLVTKHGLSEWIMAYNAGRGPVRERTLTFPLPQAPRRVVDVATGRPVEFSYAAGQVRVPQLALERDDVRVFGVDRDDPLEAVEHWFELRTKYESRPATAPQPEQFTPPPAGAVVFDRFRFRPGDAAATDLGWLTESTNGGAWKDLNYGFWDEQGAPAKGRGLYRARFTVPAAWQGRRVLLACVSFDVPVFLEQAALYVNGRPAGSYQGHPWANCDVLDVTGLVQPGSNELGVAVTATQGRGGYLGQLVAYALDRLDGVQELRTGWRLFADNRVSAPAALPLQATGRHLETDVTVPADWRPEDVFLEFDVSDKWVGLVVVNGRPLAYNPFLHPFPNTMQVCLYPAVRPGRTNRIELWGRDPENQATVRMQVQGVRLGRVRRAAGEQP